MVHFVLYIEDFSIADERKIMNVAQRKHTKQTTNSNTFFWTRTKHKYIL